MTRDRSYRLGQLIHEARTLRGLTQEELAQKVGLQDRTLISQLERGRPKKPIDPDLVNRLANVLDLSVLDLVITLGYDVRFEGIEDEREGTLLRLYREARPPYQKATIEGLQAVVREQRVEGE